MLYAVSGDLHFLGFDVKGVVDQFDTETSTEAKDKFSQKYRRMRLSKLRQHVQNLYNNVAAYSDLLKHPQNAIVLNIRNIEAHSLKSALKKTSEEKSCEYFETANIDQKLQDALDDGATESVAILKKALDIPGPRRARGTFPKTSSLAMMPNGTVQVAGAQKDGRYMIIDHEAVPVDINGKLLGLSTPQNQSTKNSQKIFEKNNGQFITQLYREANRKAKKDIEDLL